MNFCFRIKGKHPFPIVITDDKDKPVPKPIRISSSPDRHASGLTKRTEFVEEINAASINNSMLSIGKNSMEEFDGSFSRRSRSPVKNTSRGQVEVKFLGLYFSDLRCSKITHKFVIFIYILVEPFKNEINDSPPIRIKKRKY